jgi:hypothetical protein
MFFDEEYMIKVQACTGAAYPLQLLDRSQTFLLSSLLEADFKMNLLVELLVPTGVLVDSRKASCAES